MLRPPRSLQETAASLARTVRARGPEASTLGTALTPLNWLAEVMQMRGSSTLFIRPDGSELSKRDAEDIMDTFMMLVFSVRRGESTEAKSATTVLVYATETGFLEASLRCRSAKRKSTWWFGTTGTLQR